MIISHRAFDQLRLPHRNDAKNWSHYEIHYDHETLNIHTITSVRKEMKNYNKQTAWDCEKNTFNQAVVEEPGSDFGFVSH